MFVFRRITRFCLKKCLSRHKMTVFSKNLGGHGPFVSPWLRLCFNALYYVLFCLFLSTCVLQSVCVHTMGFVSAHEQIN